MSIYPPVHTTDAAVLPVEKVEISATSRYSTETIDADSRKNVVVHDVHVDGTAVIVGPNSRTQPDDVDPIVNDDEAGTSSPSPSDVSEHPDLLEETEVPNISIIQHSTAHTERTGETTSHSSELPVDNAEKPVDDVFDINKILRDMIHAGLQPRGGGNVTVATSKAITNPMKAGRDRGKEDVKEKEKDSEKLGKQKAETPKPKAKAESDKKVSSKSGKK